MLNKKGQCSLSVAIIASTIFAAIVASATNWYLSISKTIAGTDDRLEAITIAISEWQRLEHMSLEELEANRENYKNPYGVGEKFKVGITLGEQGFFAEGKCNSLTDSYAGETANCFKDTVMTVYDKSGTSMYTTRSLPLSTGSNAFPEGTILPYTGDLAKIPRGWVLCDGTNGTPDLTGRFLEGTKTTTGEFKQAGLPNITGYAMGVLDVWGSVGGVFYKSGYGVGTGDSDDDNPFLYFDASRSSPIYGKADTVQPSSYTVFYIMKTNTDFHYTNTNSAVSTTYYTKEEVDELLKNERTYSDNNYLKISSTEYVRNLSPNNLMGLKYVAEDMSIHGYYGSGEVPFATSKNSDLLNSNGYTILPSGLILQWGRNYGGYLTFPMTFPHACFIVTATRYETAALHWNGVAILHATSITQSGASFHGAINDNDGGIGYSPSASGTYSWFAIGY